MLYETDEALVDPTTSKIEYPASTQQVEQDDDV